MALFLWHTILALPNGRPGWNRGWMETGSNVWPGARVFSFRMIKSRLERLPTMHMEVRTVARGGDRGNDKQERLPCPPVKAQERRRPPAGIEGCRTESLLYSLWGERWEAAGRMQWGIVAE